MHCVKCISVYQVKVLLISLLFAMKKDVIKRVSGADKSENSKRSIGYGHSVRCRLRVQWFFPISKMHNAPKEDFSSDFSLEVVIIRL